MTRQINAVGLAIIKENEGCKLQAYLCPAKVPTIGYGHTGPEVKLGQVITIDRADALLAADLARFEDGVTHLTPFSNDNQFSALVSFAFNEGLGKLRGSTLLAKHNAADYVEAAKEFGKWTFADGKVMSGLVKRRAAEAALYSKS